MRRLFLPLIVGFTLAAMSLLSETLVHHFQGILEVQDAEELDRIIRTVPQHDRLGGHTPEPP